MKKYTRLILGKANVYAAQCFSEGFIGADYGIDEDLQGKLPDDWRAFNKAYIPVFLASHPDKTKIAAGLSCGMLWTVAKGLAVGDIVLCPDGMGSYHVGEILADYYYASGQVLPHRRKVEWRDKVVDKASMSEALQHSVNSIGTVCDISGYAEELGGLIGAQASAAPALRISDENVENPYAFAMEKQLEDFLVQNWAQTELGKNYDIYEEEGEKVGQQYPTDTGPLDILAISKDRKRLLVVELKRGRASDVVAGQILRYMGYVKDQICESGQEVSGVIIALEDDLRLQHALSIVPTVQFYRYEVDFRLVKAGQ